LSQAGNLADLLEKDDFAWLVTIDTKSCRVITTVLLTSKTRAKNLQDLLAILR
jgi:hypothetical protein